MIVRIIQKKIEPELSSWLLWTIIGGLTFATFGSDFSSSACVGFCDPLLITIILIIRYPKRLTFTTTEKNTILLVAVIFVIVLYIETYTQLANVALCMSLLVDGLAARPHVKAVWVCPHKDRPLSWIVSTIGYGMEPLVCEHYTAQNVILSLYMLLFCVMVTFPLIRYRLREKISIIEWM